MKRVIFRYFRYIRYRVCRYIYYFDACPKQFRKNYKALIFEGLSCVALCFVGVAFFMWLLFLA